MKSVSPPLPSPPWQDSNLVNSTLSNLYKKGTPTSTPKSRSAASTPFGGTPLGGTPQATPMPSDSDEDDDRDSVEMSNVTLDLAGVGDPKEDDGKQSSRKPKLLLPNVKRKEVIKKKKMLFSGWK